MTTQTHNHDPSSKRYVVVRSYYKRKAIENAHEKPNKIIGKQLLVDNSGLQDELIYSDINLIRWSIFRSRKQLYPIIIKLQKESFDTVYIIYVHCTFAINLFCIITIIINYVTVHYKDYTITISIKITHTYSPKRYVTNRSNRPYFGWIHPNGLRSFYNTLWPMDDGIL